MAIWREGVPTKQDADNRIPILRVGKGCTERAWLLGPFASVILHWIDGGSQPCLGEGCPHCPLKSYERWYGPGLGTGTVDLSTGITSLRRVIVELNESCAGSLADLADLFGVEIELRRGRADYSPTLLRIINATTSRQARSPLAVPFDVRGPLERIWTAAHPPVPEEPARDLGVISMQKYRKQA